MLRFWVLCAMLTGLLPAAIDLRLPTTNAYLFSNRPEDFYMHVDRVFEGETSQPWQGGGFGFVRNPLRLADQVICTRFHEGIDIAPMVRDRAGNPLDGVSSISDGQVVYINAQPGRSNYGRYVVVEHRWDDSSIYSLYAHLAEIRCQVGDQVQAGTLLGRMGFSGTGITRPRAHLHLEVGMLMSRNYDEWHKVNGGGQNYHGLFNGMNLIGFDAADFFLQHKAHPELRVSGFVAAVPVYFKVLVPAKQTPDFVIRYPWICRQPAEGARSWEISFSATGLPVNFAPSPREVAAPVLTGVRRSAVPHRYLTRNLLTGQGESAALTSGGQKLVALVTDTFGVATVAKEPAHPPKS